MDKPKRYSLDVDSDGAIVCKDGKTGKPVGIGRCIRIAALGDEDVTVRFDKRVCDLSDNFRAKLVELINAVGGTVWAYTEEPPSPKKKIQK